MSETSHQQPSPLAHRIVYNPNERNGLKRNERDVVEGDRLVGQLREDFGWDWVAITDVELYKCEWAFQFSIENESEGTRTKMESTELGMVVTEGREVSESVSASAGFSGFGFSATVNGSTESKTFTSSETSQIKRIEDTYVIPAKSSIFVYKRKYFFRCTTWFYHKGEKAYLKAGSRKTEGIFENSIVANEELISPTRLTGEGKIVVNPPRDAVRTTKVYNAGSFESNGIAIALQRVYPWVRIIIG
ncbi:uncharacterized protein N7498_002788 [Penicillium cinerascens]|uniref:Uncharacterized protein n=1 Tax=Penicillium cinerascens TaxID=70096 RepID=A0A9W9TBF4_9EURO|nr:uncharacterized protein N7498_002788 [Penicillium cinerascens]KAJ5216381.1 hypothetical protein N7498_002788 [Penicillium cinerascens]